MSDLQVQVVGSKTAELRLWPFVKENAKHALVSVVFGAGFTINLREMHVQNIGTSSFVIPSLSAVLTCTPTNNY